MGILMGVLVGKDKGFAFGRITSLALVGFIVALSFAFIETIWAVYLNSFVNSIVFVGFLSAAFTVVSFISYFVCISKAGCVTKYGVFLSDFLKEVRPKISSILFFALPQKICMNPVT